MVYSLSKILNRSLNYVFICLIQFIFTLTPFESVASDSTVVNKIKRPSPHGVKKSCQVCHVETEDTLNGWFTSGARKRSMLLDYNALCQQCHGIDFGHGVNRVPKMNREELPMGKEGKIACAITCHNMHIKADDYAQNRYHLRLKVPDLCLSCHDK